MRLLTSFWKFASVRFVRCLNIGAGMTRGAAVVVIVSRHACAR